MIPEYVRSRRRHSWGKTSGGGRVLGPSIGSGTDGAPTRMSRYLSCQLRQDRVDDLRKKVGSTSLRTYSFALRIFLSSMSTK